MTALRRGTVLALALAAALSQAAAAGPNKAAWKDRSAPYIIGHRGAPAFFPEHSSASYMLAIALGADFIECDVVVTKDLVPVCRHEPYLNLTTNVLDTEFADRLTTYFIDGANVTDVFTVDLTWAELRTLKLRQKDDFRPRTFDGKLRVITLEEYIKIALGAGRTVGIYPETKHPTFFNTLKIMKDADTTIQDIVLKVLEKYNYTGPYGSSGWLKQPVFIQSFEQDDLVDLRKKTCIPLVQLLDSPGFVTPDRNKTYDEMITDDSLDEIATYAAGAGPWKNMLVEEKDGELVSTGLVEKLHKRGLQIHTYTMRPEPQYINALLGNLTTFNEFDLYFKTLGLDGAFTDAANTLKAYLDAQRIVGYKWATPTLDRLNAEGVCP